MRILSLISIVAYAIAAGMLLGMDEMVAATFCVFSALLWGIFAVFFD